MNTIVLKFGGTSVADNEKLNLVANKITTLYDEGHNVVVVVSAQGKKTDQLLNEACELDKTPNSRELDVLLSSGEQVSISKLSILLNNPEKPFCIILGGAKVSDKIGVIDSLLDKVDTLMIGGGMAYTFFKAQGYSVGNSLCEEEKTGLALEAMEKAKQKGVKLLLPVDTKVGKEFKPDTESKTVAWTDIPDGWEGFDIGEKTIEMFKNELKNAKTVIWNGPVGLFEFDQFAIGTNEIAKTLADLDATTIIGGGDSGAAVAKAGLADKMTHICTGGGASLEFLEGKKLPGIECLLDK